MTSLRFDCPALGLLHLHGSITQKYTLNGMRTYLESLFFLKKKKNYIRGPTLYKSDTLKTFGRGKKYGQNVILLVSMIKYALNANNS